MISLPLNVFYGAGVPACLLILRKQRAKRHRDHVLLVYAARHFRELSAQNELRPQDVMRMLVHYHAYGEAEKVPGLVAQHSGRFRAEITRREEVEVGRLMAEYQPHADRLARCDEEISAANAERAAAKNKAEKKAVGTRLAALEKQRAKPAAKIAERDERIAEARRRAEDDRRDVVVVGEELTALYADPDELLKHASVVSLAEIQENEYNLNIPRYVDTFEPEPRVPVKDALRALREVEMTVKNAESELAHLLKTAGYAE